MFILENLKNYGVDLYDPNLPPVVGMCLVLLVLSICSILCFLNIVFYFIVLFSFETEFIKNIIKNYKLLGKIIRFYRNSSYYFIGLEIILFLYINSIILDICFNIVYDNYSKLL